MFFFSPKSRTELCKIMMARGSDKGGLVGMGRHNYTPFYTQLFSSWRYRPLKIFEMGLGSNNLAVPSNMGRKGRPGASLYGWSDYFPHAQVYGGDVDRQILFEDSKARIKTYWVDQTSKEAIDALWANDDLRDESFDIILDDGLHAFEANQTFLEQSIHKLARHGIYVIEDVVGTVLKRWVSTLSHFTERNPLLSGQIVQVKNPTNQYDNNLIVVRYARELTTVPR